MLDADKQLKDSLIQSLSPHCEGAIFEAHRLGCRTPYIHLKRPKPKAFEVLARTSIVLNIMRIEMALDILTPTQTDAHEVHDWFLRHLVEKWRGKKITNSVGESSKVNYSSLKRSVSNQVAIYSDRPAKLSGGACCHIERRIRGRSAIYRAGLSLSDLANMEVRDYKDWWRDQWTNTIRFRKLNTQKLLRCIRKEKKPLGRPSKHYPRRKLLGDEVGRPIYDREKRLAYLIIRRAEYLYLECLAKQHRAINEYDVSGSMGLQRVVDALTFAHGFRADDYLDAVMPPA